MNVHNALDAALSAVGVLHGEWTMDGLEVLCDGTPIIVLPEVIGSDIGRKMRNDLITTLVNAINVVGSENINKAPPGPWTADESLLYFNATAIAYLSESAKVRVPFQVAALSLLLSVFNTLTPKHVRVDYNLLPTLNEDGYTVAEGEVIERTFAFSPDGFQVNMETIKEGDMVVRAVYSNMYPFAHVETMTVTKDALGKPSPVDPLILSNIQIVYPELHELITFKDMGCNKVFTKNNSILLV